MKYKTYNKQNRNSYKNKNKYQIKFYQGIKV